MFHRRQPILLIVIAILAGLGFVSTGLAYTYFIRLRASEALIQSHMRETWKLTPVRSLSRAALLLPEDIKAIRGGPVSLDLYWILAQTKSGDIRWGEKEYQLWLVNTSSTEKHLIRTHRAGAGFFDLGLASIY